MTSSGDLLCSAVMALGFYGVAARYKVERRRWKSAFRIEDSTKSGFPNSKIYGEGFMESARDVSSTADLPYRVTVRLLEECCDRRWKGACSLVPGDNVRHEPSTTDLSTGVEVSAFWGTAEPYFPAPVISTIVPAVRALHLLKLLFGDPCSFSDVKIRFSVRTFLFGFVA